MGAKNTGVYLNHFEQGEDPTTSGNIQGKTIVIDGTNITWSQAGRTKKRHQIRASKRSKLSKRLLKLVLKDYTPQLLTQSLNTRPRCSKSSNISKLAQAGDNL
jgi:hypothetical protein